MLPVSPFLVAAIFGDLHLHSPACSRVNLQSIPAPVPYIPQCIKKASHGEPHTRSRTLQHPRTAAHTRNRTWQGRPPWATAPLQAARCWALASAPHCLHGAVVQSPSTLHHHGGRVVGARGRGCCWARGPGRLHPQRWLERMTMWRGWRVRQAVWGREGCRPQPPQLLGARRRLRGKQNGSGQHELAHMLPHKPRACRQHSAPQLAEDSTREAYGMRPTHEEQSGHWIPDSAP
jgi:hypothetical protein